MKGKINLLIGFSAVALVVLSAMQFYLVKTAYDYKTAQFRDEIKAKIGAITQDYSAIDSSFYYEKDQAYKAVAEDYILNKSIRSLAREHLIRSKFKATLSRKLREQLQEELPDLKIDFAVVLNKFVLYQNHKAPDTIFAGKPQISNTLYGSLSSFDDAFLIRNYVGTASGSVLKGQQPAAYQLLTEDTLYVTIENWQWIILRRMTAILVVAVCAILTLVTLFLIAIKALIRQKKVSDVKTDFINNITHEFKTPLTTMAVSTKILAKKEVQQDPARLSTVLDTMERQNVRLQSLIDQVMANSLGHDEIELRRERVHTTVLLEALVTDFRIAHPEVTIALTLEASAVLLLDTFHLTTALVNVLDNAVKYGSTHIQLRAVLERQLFCISILDNGIGIARNKQMLLFDKFYRVAEGNLHSTKGLGLGLYYVDQILKAHQGSISVYSELGKGAQFNLSIPTAL